MKELEEMGLTWAVKHRPEVRTGDRVVTFDCGLIRLRECDCVLMFSSDIKTVSARVFCRRRMAVE